MGGARMGVYQELDGNKSLLCSFIVATLSVYERKSWTEPDISDSDIHFSRA